MGLPKPPLTGKDQFGATDTTPEENRRVTPPPEVKKNIPKALGRLARLANKLGRSKLGAALKSKVLPLAGRAALGPVGGALAAQIAGKYATPLLGKLTGKLSSVSKSATAVSTGVEVDREKDPKKLRRPFKEGFSIAASAAGKPLAETASRSLLSTLGSAMSIGVGIGTALGTFKTVAALARSPRFFNPTGATPAGIDPNDAIAANRAFRHVEVSTPEERLYPQAGLLEDELMYRLVLLAENVYEPTRLFAQNKGWGVPIILEAFRAENSTTSPHERGEALDICLDNTATADRYFELAQWMRDNILYDQLILCYDISGSNQTWIHVTFTIENRRREVKTKTFNDTFVDGLHIYKRTTGTDTATQANVEEGDKFIDMLAAREQRLNPVTSETQTPQELTKPFKESSDTNPRQVCTSDPFGNPYVPDNSKQGVVLAIVAELLAIPEYLAMAQAEDRRVMVPFAREVARRAGVGMNAVRGNRSDPSGDAIAIYNPTAGKGFGSWDSDKRVQIMDIVVGAHGGSGSSPSPGWIDVTSICEDDTGGGYIEP